LAINFESTGIMLNACKAEGIKRLVFASSCSVYGANGNALLVEGSALNPVSLYARTRIMSEEVLLGQAGDVEVIILRLSTVCGLSPRMRFDLLVNTMTARALDGGKVTVMGAEQWRPHIHVQDVAEAFALSATADLPPEAVGCVFNVGGADMNFTIGDVAEKVAVHVPGTAVEYRDGGGDLRSYRVGFDRIRSVLGFTPTLTVDDAIVEIRDALRGGAISGSYSDPIYSNLQYLQRRLDARNAGREHASA
jgi:nucleoside-diphosphate-sugar epimerase